VLHILSVFAALVAFAPPQALERNLHDERQFNKARERVSAKAAEVDYLQRRLDRLSMRCEGRDLAACKEVPDIDNEIKGLRGEPVSSTLTARIKAVDEELQSLERRFMAE